MAKAKVEYLTAADRAVIHEQTMHVLESVGVAYNTPALTRPLEEAGARVDPETLTVRIPWDLVENCLRTVPDKVLLAGRDPSYDRLVGGPELICSTDGNATHMLDDATGLRRPATRDDLARLMRLFDALPEVDCTLASVLPGDAPTETITLETALLSFENSRKHLQDAVRSPDEVPALIEILEAVAGAPLRKRPIYSVYNCTVAPLQHDRATTEAHLRLAAEGVPVFVLPMPQMATTAPKSVVGTGVVNLAELLSAVVFFQLVAPGCPMVSVVGGAATDLRSGAYIAATPEAALINVVGIEMSRHYGLPVEGSAVTCDSRACDMQAGVESALTGMACVLAGADALLAVGLVDGARTASLAKAVLDMDTIGALRRFTRDARVDESTILVDDILEVGIGGEYMTRPSSRRDRGPDVWQPSVWSRDTTKARTGGDLVGEAAARAEELIATHSVPPLPDDVRELACAIIRKRAAGAA